ncbi:MAG TPA: hypothetical protein VLE19_09425 [Pyrinomonadaceae bacterium]|nr:hypothetical protein [Pyrinomonadaceae bacterium]
MTMERTAMWLCILAGTLWILAGIRDLFAPGFFNISGRVVTGSGIALNFAIGAVFLVVGSSMARRIGHSKGKTPNKTPTPHP